MKFIISVMILYSATVRAGLVSIEYEEHRRQEAKYVMDIFIQKYEIPPELISLKEVSICRERVLKKSGISFCVDINRQLNFTEFSNFELTKKTILSFSEKRGERYAF